MVCYYQHTIDEWQQTTNLSMSVLQDCMQANASWTESGLQHLSDPEECLDMSPESSLHSFLHVAQTVRGECRGVVGNLCLSIN